MRPISRNEYPLARRRRTSCSIFGDRCRGIYALPVSSSNDGWLTEKLRGPFESTTSVASPTAVQVGAAFPRRVGGVSWLGWIDPPLRARHGRERARLKFRILPRGAACCRKREVVDSLKSRSQGCDDPFSQRGSRRFESAHLHCCQMGEKDRRGKAGQRPGSERQPARQQGQRPGGRRDKRAAGGATGERDGRAAGRRHRRAHARNARTAGREGQATAGSAGGHSAKGRKLRGRHTGAHVRPRGGGTSGW